MGARELFRLAPGPELRLPYPIAVVPLRRGSARPRARSGFAVLALLGGGSPDDVTLPGQITLTIDLAVLKHMAVWPQCRDASPLNGTCYQRFGRVLSRR
jgi:hypothetical protein